MNKKVIQMVVICSAMELGFAENVFQRNSASQPVRFEITFLRRIPPVA